MAEKNLEQAALDYHRYPIPGKIEVVKIFAGLDAFDIEINESDPKEFVKTVARLAPTFGGINLEDIKAPECFEIEKDKKESLDKAMKDADVFLGLSVADVVTPDMLRSMAERPIVFALANPSPEIAYDLAVNRRHGILPSEA